MYPVASDRLRGIKTFVQLTSYLREELDWPLNEYVFDQLTFEYQPSELGLKELDGAQATIHQLRPLVAGQPWGIFFIEFDKNRLPVVVLRRILSHLVIKKRGSANRAERATWNAGDLLFISAFGNVATDDREIAFAHFHQESGDLPTLHVLGWDGGNTSLTLASIEETLKARLCWPKDSSNAEAWRNQWSGAFRHRIGHIIRTATKLAEVLAILARGIRDRAKTMLAAENENGPLTKLFRAFQTALFYDLTPDTFADTYAQSITYGLLTAAFSHSEMAHNKNDTPLVADNVTDNVPVTNPFLKEMLQTFLKAGGRKAGIDFDELGVQDVVALLRSDETDLSAIIKDFGRKNSDKDPVVYFYEHFLSAYDHEQKVKRGVFYTPQPVVSYIVRSAHEFLQTEFGLEDGLADTATWADVAKSHNGLKIPAGVDPHSDFVQILDPATGTATFPVEIIDTIYRTLVAKWNKVGRSEQQQQAAWNEYVPRHLLSRLHGYELMMAPYAIAHMKIGLKLYETGYRFRSEERVRIYLTNALEPPSDLAEQPEFEAWAPALAHEAQAVNAIKRLKRFTVVIGNPPYSNFGQLNKIPFILNLLDDYKRGLDEKKINLDDDFIKFIRFSQYLLDTTGAGIFGMITNNVFIDGVTHRRMRESLKTSFTDVRILDLHGSSKKLEESPDGTKDENVFDIQQGVGIALLVKNASTNRRSVYHAELWGQREKKSETLRQSVLTTFWKAIESSAPNHFLVPKDFSLIEEYKSFCSLVEIFANQNAGIQTKNDRFVYAISRIEIEARITDLKQEHAERVVQKYDLSLGGHWDIDSAQADVRKNKGVFVQVLNKPFDKRWTYYTAKTSGFMARPRAPVMRCGLIPNLILLTVRNPRRGNIDSFFVADTIVDKDAVSPFDNATVFPLFLPNDDGQQVSFNSEKRLNFGRSFLMALCTRLNLSRQAADLPEGLAPEDIFHYAYAVVHSPGYRSRYAEFLKIDFPRLPLTGSLQLFRALARLGEQLVALHLLESPKLDKFHSAYTGPGKPEVEKISYGHDTVWLDRAQTRGFCGVPEAVWNFHIGGYQVCEKWLKDRKGRTLSKDDIAHYNKVVAALGATIQIMAEIDVTIEKYGGWPVAFSDKPVLPVNVLGLKPKRELVKLHPAL
jgi:type ISP restriction-modification system protein/Eco57I restriction-modification methylase